MRVAEEAGRVAPRRASRTSRMLSDRYLTTTSAPAHRRPPPPRRAARGGRGGHRAVPPSRSRVLRAGHRHQGRAGPLLAHRGHAGRARASISCPPRSTRAPTASRIDTFQVNDPFGEAVTEDARWRRTLDALRRVLRSEQTVEALLAARRSGRARRRDGGGPAQDLGRQPALGHAHRRRGEVSGPRGAPLPHHADASSRSASTSAAPASPPRSSRRTTPST